MNKYRKWAVICLFLCLLSCKKQAPEPTKNEVTATLFEIMPDTYTGITFENRLTETETFNFLLYEYLQNGGGVAIGDINNDGLPDIYFIGNMIENKLYLNEGNFKFKDITAQANLTSNTGFKTGATMVDINQDGFIDIYVCKSALGNPEMRRNELFINNGDLTFTEKSKDYGLDDPSYSNQAYFIDIDKDNDLDLYLINHPGNLQESNNIKAIINEKGEYVIAKPDSYEYISDRLYRNDNGKFTDITEQAGILNEAFALSAVIIDINEDSLPDIYVCNDYIKPDFLYINQGDNTFKESFDSYFRHSSFSSMGSDIGDINNDGNLDLMTLDMLPRDNYRQKMLGMSQNYDKFQKMLKLGLKPQYSQNTLQLNNGLGNFSNIAFMSDVANTDWSWSTLLADFDNDGFKDIFISNGYVRDVTNNDYSRYKMNELQRDLNAGKLTMLNWLDSIPQQKIPSYLFKNSGNLAFKDVSESWNSGPPAFSSGAAYADLDNDGFLDLVVSNINQQPFILKNKGKQLTKNNYVNLKFPSTGKNTIGTIAKAYLSNGMELTEYYHYTKGFLSSSEPLLHFGIPENTTINKIDIIWPDGFFQTLINPELNRTSSITYNATEKYVKPKREPTYFETFKTSTQISHVENDYIDFKREPLLHHMISQEGPAAAIADVNGDGLQDIYMGGSTGNEGSLYIQNQKGDFTKKNIPSFSTDKKYEDVSALFFDANNDGYADLYVVSGSNEKEAYSSAYQDRLYINDGKGNLTRAPLALPEITSSGSVVLSLDIDNDGDLDLFIGGRNTPGRYPEAPESILLENNKGSFTNATQKWGKELMRTGMVTDAVFADIDKDSMPELIIVGEWMPISVFKWTNNEYKNITKDLGLENATGWWYSLAVEDVTNDGFPEIIAGNLGLNSEIKTSPEKPVILYYSDFDNNGTIDPVLCYYNGEKSYPLHFRDRLQDQMIFLKKKFTRYEPYANATIEDIFSEEQLKKASRLKANSFEHTVFLNKNGKGFEAKPLPRETQISAVKSILLKDLNNDGNKDLIIGGNLYSTDAQLGRYDASTGNVLIGNGDGSFNVISPAESGLNIPGNVCDLLPIEIQQQPLLFVVKNNDTSLFVKQKNL